MKYLIVFVTSLTVLVLLLAACSTGGGEPTAEPEATETTPALATAVATEAPAPTDESYPANPTPIPTDESYPGEAPTVEPINPYPDQNAVTDPNVSTGSAYPSEVDLSDIDPGTGDGQPQEMPKPGVPDESAATAHMVSQDLASRLDLDVSEITVASAMVVQWTDSSLGCPAPGFAYAQVITSGHQIILEADGEQYTYHTDLNGNFVLCGENGQPVE
jgi:hypothetical protein